MMTFAQHIKYQNHIMSFRDKYIKSKIEYYGNS